MEPLGGHKLLDLVMATKDKMVTDLIRQLVPDAGQSGPCIRRLVLGCGFKGGVERLQGGSSTQTAASRAGLHVAGPGPGSTCLRNGPHQ
jgi:hypothetical protein